MVSSMWRTQNVDVFNGEYTMVLLVLFSRCFGAQLCNFLSLIFYSQDGLVWISRSEKSLFP